ncbi:hypothetical protein FQA39_LY05480 [Lamprigera yunnana]|nr:hypothetical protein FQA39_LY05480 [Lamprigera yunnana]
MAPTYKVVYFPLKVLAEPIRFLLSYGEIDFEDIRIERKEWPQSKGKMPFGQMPVLEVDGKQAHQSIAICRYLAKKVKLNGADEWEDLQIDSVVDTISDLRKKTAVYYKEKDVIAKEKYKTLLYEEILPYYLERLEKLAKVNNGHFIGGKFTWADFYFAGLMDTINFLAGKEVINDYPNLQQVHKNVVNLPAIKAWIEKSPQSEL